MNIANRSAVIPAASPKPTSTRTPTASSRRSAPPSVEAALARDPELAARVAEIRAQNATLRDALDPVLAEPIPERLLDAARRPARAARPRRRAPMARARLRAPRRRWCWAWGSAGSGATR